MISRRCFIAIAIASCAFSSMFVPACATGERAARPSVRDPLPSWNDGPARQSIVSFVEAVTTEGSPDFVRPEERIAVFDNDGTLWAEQPMYFQFYFVMDRVRALSPAHPEWNEKEPFRSALAGDMNAVMASGREGIAELIMATHTGMSTEEFEAIVAEWMGSARHPESGKPFDQMVFQPMVEVLRFLRASGFKTYIVSGGGVEFMRPWTEAAYGIPPEQVIGSVLTTALVMKDGRPVIMREPGAVYIDDGRNKALAINRVIGRRPIAAFGNSDGDLQMLEWTAAGSGRSLVALVHHDDKAREWSYDRSSRIGKLDKALDDAERRGWTVISMKSDWSRVFPTWSR